MIEGNYNHGHNCHGQDDVADEDDIVEPVDPSRGMAKDSVSGRVVVVPQVATEKDSRGDEGGDHAFFMGLAIFLFDETE